MFYLFEEHIRIPPHQRFCSVHHVDLCSRNVEFKSLRKVAPREKFITRSKTEEYKRYKAKQERTQKKQQSDVDEFWRNVKENGCLNILRD